MYAGRSEERAIFEFADDLQGLRAPVSQSRLTKLSPNKPSPWRPAQYRDTYFQDLKKRIDQKIKNGETKDVAGEDRPRMKNAGGENMIDLLPLLKKSLAGKKRRAG